MRKGRMASVDPGHRWAILETVDRFCRDLLDPQSAAIDKEGKIPNSIYRRAGEVGLFRIDTPEEYGGIGTDPVLPLLAAERIARSSAAFAVTFANCADVLVPIIEAAHHDVAAEFVPRIASGELVPCLSISEPGTGSDVASMRTRAEKVAGGYRISGRKMWCTNGSIGDVYVVFAKTDPTLGAKGISAFLVTKEAVGFERGGDEPLVGLHGNPTSELNFENVFVDEKYRLGAEGDGFRIAMITLDSARLNAAGMAIGIARAAFEHAREYALTRHQFGKPIFDHQGLQFLLSKLATHIEMGRTVWLQGLDALGRGDSSKAGALASTAKLLCGRIATEVTTQCVQIMGANGLSKDCPVERHLRDSRAFEIFDGTPQIQRLLIARYLMRHGLMLF